MIFSQLTADATAWVSFLDPTSVFSSFRTHSLLLAEAAPNESAASESLIVAGVLLSLVVVYFASKLGGEICARLDLPPVLGELVGGVVVGVSALHLLVFPEASADVSNVVLVKFLETTAGLSPETARRDHFVV